MSKPILIIGIIFWTAVSIVWTRDQIAFNTARWEAGRWLLAQGVPPDEIDGGFEFNCAHLAFRGPAPSLRHIYTGSVWLRPVFLLTLDTFARSYPQVPGSDIGVVYHQNHTYHRIKSLGSRRFLYGSILDRRLHEIQIWKTAEIPSEAPHIW